jgi:hypothetical protein
MKFDDQYGILRKELRENMCLSFQQSLPSVVQAQEWVWEVLVKRLGPSTDAKWRGADKFRMYVKPESGKGPVLEFNRNYGPNGLGGSGHIFYTWHNPKVDEICYKTENWFDQATERKLLTEMRATDKQITKVNRIIDKNAKWALKDEYQSKIQLKGFKLQD